MLTHNITSSAIPQTLGGMAQRTISATKRYRGYVQQVQFEQMAEQEMSLWLPTLARLSQDTGWILWVAPPFTVDPDTLTRYGIAPQRLLTIVPKHPGQALSLVQTALQCKHYSAVFWWSQQLTSQQHELLNHAAQMGESVGIVMHQEAPQPQSH
jgi:cell division inhibitor SulA